MPNTKPFNIKETPKYYALTGRNEAWIANPQNRLPVSCTCFVVEDTMEGPNGIEDSWIFTSYGLRNAQGVAISLRNIRPAGKVNDKGLVASGPCSFAKFYSLINQELRRGGTYKNGAVNLHLDYNHADVVDFMLMDRSELPWAFKTIDVDDNFISYLADWEINRTVTTSYINPVDNTVVYSKRLYKTALDVLIANIQSGDLFLSKIVYDKDGNRLDSNVCVTDTTWVETTEGPKQVKDLINTPFTTIVNGKEYKSSSPLLNGKQSDLIGFYPTGYKSVYTLKTLQGWEVEVTGNHKVMTDNGLIPASQLKPGDKIKLNSLQGYAWNGGVGNHDQGWLLGQLIGDGCFSTDKSAMLYFYNEKQDLISNALDKLNNENITFTTRHETGINDGGSRTIIRSSGLATLAQTFNVTKVNKKAVNELFESGSMEFYKGFIQGLFDADACITSSDKTRPAIQITQVSLKTLQTVQRMLLRLGIVSKIHKAKQKAGLQPMPNSNRESTLYACQESHRLDITGQTNLKAFQEQINFSFETKKEKLAEALNSYSKNDYKLSAYVTFESLTFKEITHVYDCTIKDIHLFPANGLVVSNCLEVYFTSRATCNIGHTNYGTVKPSEIPTAMVDNMHYLCNLHAYTNVGNDGKYLCSDEDRQILLGVLGFANLLALEDVTYLDFVIALENITKISTATNYTDKAFEIASYINHGYVEAGKVARSYNMDRYFGIAPTATCSYKYKDKYGYTTTPEIAPPISQTVERDSSTFGAVMYEYPPNVEIADRVGFETFFRLNNAWQRMMELAGEETGAHSISTNWWSDKVEMNREFLQKWSDSYQRSLYYSLAVSSDTLNKADILTLNNVDVSCPIANNSGIANNKEVCIPCGE